MGCRVYTLVRSRGAPKHPRRCSGLRPQTSLTQQALYLQTLGGCLKHASESSRCFSPSSVWYSPPTAQHAVVSKAARSYDDCSHGGTCAGCMFRERSRIGVWISGAGWEWVCPPTTIRAAGEQCAVTAVAAVLLSRGSHPAPVYTYSSRVSLCVHRLIALCGMPGHGCR